jgi:hypothetical protein
MVAVASYGVDHRRNHDGERDHCVREEHGDRFEPTAEPRRDVLRVGVKEVVRCDGQQDCQNRKRGRLEPDQQCCFLIFSTKAELSENEVLRRFRRAGERSQVLWLNVAVRVQVCSDIWVIP